MANTGTTNHMTALLAQGQSVWLDYLRRGMLRDGDLAARIQDGLRGMTSNPSIFEKAIDESTDYDAALRDRTLEGKTDVEVFEELAVEDVREACDEFRSLYDATDGADGFVSIEVNPRLARETEASLAEAHRLWREVGRPNVMVKIPGTHEGWSAIERALGEGLNINITLLFSVGHYREVAEAYLRALEARVRLGQPVHRIASVASFFVSRVDTEVDKRLHAGGDTNASLRGQAAVANATLAYALFRELFSGPRWNALAARGARVQRPLWASTSTKDKAYSDVKYVEALIGADTITTVPPDTLAHFEDHGVVTRTLPGDPGQAAHVMQALAKSGIDFADVTQTLETEGIEKFAKSYETLLATLKRKRQALAAA